LHWVSKCVTHGNENGGRLGRVTRSIAVRLALLAAIWGCSFLFIKVGLEGLSPTQIVLGRMAAGSAALLVVAAIRHQRLPSDFRLWVHLTVFAVLGNLLPFLLFAFGEERIASSRAGVLNATTPLCTLVVAMLFLPEERPDRHRLLGLVVGFAGVVVVVGPWNDHGGGSLSGQIACLGAAALYGVSFVYARRFITRPDVPPGALAAAQLLAGTGVMVLLSPFVARHAMHLNVRVAASVLVLGAAGTGIAYLVYHGLLRDAGATTTSLVTYLIPITAVVLGVTVLDEQVTWNLFAGAAVVIFGVALSENRVPLGTRADDDAAGGVRSLRRGGR
jgi:drug/metabolite transporter (DMT)-like permease